MSELVTERMLALAQCLCEAVTEHDELPDLCFCGLMPGQQVIDQWISDGGACEDKNGQGWVRLVSAFDSARFPEPVAGYTNCTSGELAIGIEIGIHREVAVAGEDGGAPSAEALFEATNFQMLDMQLMRRVIKCCFTGEYVMQSYTPYGPIGGVVGGAWTVLMNADPDDEF